MTIVAATHRHMTTGQKAAFADAWRGAEEAKAKERMHKGRPSSKEPVENFPQDNGKARDLVGQRVGISGKSVDHYRQIKESAPEVAEKVKAGEISVAWGGGGEGGGSTTSDSEQ